MKSAALVLAPALPREDVLLPSYLLLRSYAHCGNGELAVLYFRKVLLLCFLSKFRISQSYAMNKRNIYLQL